MKRLLLFLLSFTFLVSCQDQELNEDNFSSPAGEITTKSTTISGSDQEKAISMLNEFRDFLQEQTAAKASTNSLEKTLQVKSIRSKVYRFDTSSEGKGYALNKSDDISSDVEIYTITFEENGKTGFSIVCPDSRINRIYAYTEAGALSDTTFNMGLKMFLSDIKNICEQDLSDYNEEALSSSVTASRPVGYYTTGNLLNLAWSQASPYNLDCPSGCTYTDNYRGHVPAGCGEIAVAQAMLHYKDDMIRSDFDYDALTAQSQITMSSPASLRDEVADYVYTIGGLYNSIYSCNGTTTTLEDVENVFESFLGWTYPEWNLNFIEGALDQCRVFGAFMAHDLILTRGYNYSTGGHAFLYTGMVYHMYLDDYSMQSVDQLYVNWGWGGTDNGYYAFSSSGGSYSYLRQHVYIQPYGNPGCGGGGGGIESE